MSVTVRKQCYNLNNLREQKKTILLNNKRNFHFAGRAAAECNNRSIGAILLQLASRQRIQLHRYVRPNNQREIRATAAVLSFRLPAPIRLATGQRQPDSARTESVRARPAALSRRNEKTSRRVRKIHERSRRGGRQRTPKGKRIDVVRKSVRSGKIR